MIRGIIGQHIQQPSDFLAFVVAAFTSHLRVLEERTEYTKICVHKSTLASALCVFAESVGVAFMRRLEIEKIPDKNIDNHVKVVCVEVLVSGRRSEDQIKKLEDEQLWTEIHLAIED
jgi:hypothetical protein